MSKRVETFAKLRLGSLTALAPLVVCLLTVAGCGKSDTGAASNADGEVADSRDAEAEDEGWELAPLSEEDLHPIVVLETSEGDLRLRLDAEHAPETTRNFLDYVESKHYDRTIFHHVEDGYALIGGAYTQDLIEKPGRYPIRNEADNGLKNVTGAIGMIRDPEDPHSAVCQFYINLADNPRLDHRGEGASEFGYCVFGEVIDGLETLQRLSRVETRSEGPFENLPAEAIMVQTARRVR